ncbi:hypothetical protein Tco_0414843 [Tanacetum coccineum]
MFVLSSLGLVLLTLTIDLKTQQVVARDEKWVPSAKRVKISSTNLRLETTVQQNEETFQVVIDIIKNSTCFKAFTISTDVPEIFMQRFWYTIKKVQGTDSYEFLLANKKCRVDAEIFRKILDICPRVEGEEFTEVQNDDDTLTFLIDLGYKGPLHKYTNMYVDHMSQPWRTLAAIINKCLSGKTTSNDRLRKSRIDIMWGMFYRENVDYHKLIWEDFAYQIDHRRERKSRRENMPFPRFTKVIINHFLKQYKSISNLKYQHYHTIKDDGIVSRLKFVRIGEDYQEYGLAIPDETINVSEESEPEPQLVKKKTASRRVVKKKVTISAADNIIPDPNVALELAQGCSIFNSYRTRSCRYYESSQRKQETSRRQPGTGGSSEGTGTIPGVPNESTVVSATSSEGTGTKPGVPNKEKVTSEEKVILEWGSEQESKYSEKDQLNDEEKNDKDGDANDEGNDHISDTQDTDDADAET